MIGFVWSLVVTIWVKRAKCTPFPIVLFPDTAFFPFRLFYCQFLRCTVLADCRNCDPGCGIGKSGLPSGRPRASSAHLPRDQIAHIGNPGEATRHKIVVSIDLQYAMLRRDKTRRCSCRGQWGNWREETVEDRESCGDGLGTDQTCDYEILPSFNRKSRELSEKAVFSLSAAEMRDTSFSEDTNGGHLVGCGPRGDRKNPPKKRELHVGVDNVAPPRLLGPAFLAQLPQASGEKTRGTLYLGTCAPLLSNVKRRPTIGTFRSCASFTGWIHAFQSQLLRDGTHYSIVLSDLPVRPKWRPQLKALKGQLRDEDQGPSGDFQARSP